MADKETVRMAGDYEIIQSIRMGGMTMLIGYNPTDTTYMTCYQDYDLWAMSAFQRPLAAKAMLRS